MTLHRRTSSTAATTRRFSPRSLWKDPRLAGGLVLIGVAVALGSWAVDAASNTQNLYVITKDVAPGEDLSAAGVLSVVDSNPGTDSYLQVGDLPEHAVAMRSLSSGELLPKEAVGTKTSEQLRSLVLELASALPAGTKAGDIVDLWSLPQTDAGQPKATDAQVVATGLVVAHLGQEEADFIGTTTTRVEVLVGTDALAPVLTAVGNSGSLVLVPTGQGV